MGLKKTFNEFVVCVWRYMLFKCQIEAATMTIQQPVSSKHHAWTYSNVMYIIILLKSSKNNWTKNKIFLAKTCKKKKKIYEDQSKQC